MVRKVAGGDHIPTVEAIKKETSMSTNLLKFGRDLLVGGIGGMLFIVGNYAADLGIPNGYAVPAAAGALYLYRALRERGWLDAMGAEPKND